MPSQTPSTPIAVSNGLDPSHDRDFFWFDRTDWSHGAGNPPDTSHDWWWHNGPEANHISADDLQALITQWEVAAHQIADTLSHVTPPAVSQWINSIEQAFHLH
jgi:hypothetical protein